MQPRMVGTSGFSLADDKVTVTVERVGNPQPGQLGGTLALGCGPTALPAGEPDGWQLSATALGNIMAGQQAWRDLSFTQPATRPRHLVHRPAAARMVCQRLRHPGLQQLPLPVSWSARKRRLRPCRPKTLPAAVRPAAEPSYRQTRRKAKPTAKPRRRPVAAPASVSSTPPRPPGWPP